MKIPLSMRSETGAFFICSQEVLRNLPTGIFDHEGQAKSLRHSVAAMIDCALQSPINCWGFCISGLMLMVAWAGPYRNTGTALSADNPQARSSHPVSTFRGQVRPNGNAGYCFHQHYSLATTQSSSAGLCVQRMRLMMFSMRLS